ncbi:MAG: filamentous hemagglutinin N-terminal domain-containing protein, partial [Fusobacterium sp. JB019]|nr:filamentous hemagglutinin N-terminal domain-containing protein [Fusobacterium sp. JB019]
MKKKDLDSKSKKIIGGLISLAIYNLVSPLDVVSYAAGVIVDEDALSKHQAIIRKTKNNIDQVDIVTPNERGLSHNKFLKFNVDENGMILNNSSQMTLTDLAGLIYGNPNIEAGKEAKTILSEVTGLTRSEIEGFIEIAGKEAEFILANPNGIYLSNGGFLNTSKVTMTTGKLVDEINENGGIVFKITDGQVELASGGSINIARVDYFNIISKASKIGGALHSGRTENRSTKEIKILTGSNTFNYETGEYTSEEGATSNYEYGIDASELGAMSAGKITLIATDKGVGVNSKGQMVATIDDLTVDSKGNVLLKNAATRVGDIKVNVEGDFTQDGNKGLILAEKDLKVNATGKVSFKGNDGYAKGKDNVKISGKELEVSNGSTLISMDEDQNRVQNVEINTEKVNVYGEDSLIVSGKTLDINVKSKLEDGTISYTDNNQIYNEGTIIAANVDIDAGKIYNKKAITGRDILNIASKNIDNAGKILGVNKLNISGNGSLTNMETGELSSNVLVNIDGYNDILNSGKILSGSELNIINSNSVLNSETGKIQSSREALISSTSLDNKGSIYAATRLNINSDSFTNEGSTYSETTNISGKTSGKGSLINKSSGRIISTDETNITSSELVSNEGSIKGNGVTINTENVNNDGTIVAGDKSLDIDASKNITNKGTLL